MFSSRRLSSSLNFSFLPGSRSSATSPTADMSRRNRQSSVQLVSPATASARSNPSAPASPNADFASPVSDQPRPTLSPLQPLDPEDLTITFVPQPTLNSSHPSLSFTKITRTLSTPQAVIRIGRYSDPQRVGRDDQPDVGISSHGAASDDAGASALAPTTTTSAASGHHSADQHHGDGPIGFKSKVVSRRHCEIWYQGSEWYIKDVKSSSGTFVNHFRLSGPKSESLPYRIRSGDTIQLGIDFRGGQEEVFRCVKMTVLIGKNAQPRVTAFNRANLKNLTASGGKAAEVCSICLCKISPCQALFMAPCSHVWHYKCILRLLAGPSSPSFLCPNCRSLSSLDAEIEDYPDEDDASADAEQTKLESGKDLAEAPGDLIPTAVSLSAPVSDPESNGMDDATPAAPGPARLPDIEPLRDNPLAFQVATMSISTGQSGDGDLEQSNSDSSSRRDLSPDVRHTAVNPTPPSPKVGSESSSRSPATPPQMSFLDADTAAAAIMAVSGPDFPGSNSRTGLTSAAGLPATPSNATGPYASSSVSDDDLNRPAAIETPGLGKQ